MIGKSQRVVTVLKRIRCRLIATGLWAFAVAASIATPAQAQLVNASICHYRGHVLRRLVLGRDSVVHAVSNWLTGTAAAYAGYGFSIPNAILTPQVVA